MSYTGDALPGVFAFFMHALPFPKLSSRLFLASLGAQSKTQLSLLKVLGLIFAVGSHELWKYCSY